MTFDEYWKLLWIIKRDSNVEQYYDELLRPLFKESIKDTKNVKVVPTFDTRYHGKSKTKYACITGTDDKFVWPDYIFVPNNYTHTEPTSPYIKVEFKIPNVSEKNSQIIYYPIYKSSIRFYNEITSELSETPLILTDGITWLFLNSQSDIDKIKSEKDIEKICFFDKRQKYYKGNYVELFQDAHKQFIILKKKINNFIKESKQYQTVNFGM